MSVKELMAELEGLNEAELREVALYVSFLKFRAWRAFAEPLPDTTKLAELYAEFAEDDRQLAEIDMDIYMTMLQIEDNQ
jgi:hypothetical protein